MAGRCCGKWTPPVREVRARHSDGLRRGGQRLEVAVVHRTCRGYRDQGQIAEAPRVRPRFHSPPPSATNQQRCLTRRKVAASSELQKRLSFTGIAEESPFQSDTTLEELRGQLILVYTPAYDPESNRIEW